MVDITNLPIPPTKIAGLTRAVMKMVSTTDTMPVAMEVDIPVVIIIQTLLTRADMLVMVPTITVITTTSIIMLHTMGDHRIPMVITMVTTITKKHYVT